MTTVSSKLESINVMMTAIGESPVNTITSSTTTDVSIAIQILDNVKLLHIATTYRSTLTLIIKLP